MLRFFVALFLAAGAAASAQPAGEPSAEAWRQLARVDAEAAIRLIAENHPGAEASLGDRMFQERLQTARVHVAERLPKVDGFYGYSALMSGLAAEFRDGHIWSTPLVRHLYGAWAGLVLERRGGGWHVAAQQREGGDPDLAGHRLVACDGTEADAWARERIGLFRGDPDIEAQLAASAAWLLLRDGNPFLKRPEACTFEAPDGTRREVRLNWRQAELQAIEPILAKSAPAPSAGMGIEAFGEGYWIGLETLGAEAETVVEAAGRQREALRAAPVVVLDLRGNGGGNSAYAETIARTLAGDERVAAANRTGATCTGSFWRVSPGNLKTLEDWHARLREAGDAQSAAYVGGLAEDMEAALASGRPFAPALPDCAKETKAAGASAAPRELPPSRMKGRLILVTDRQCFSSCLIAADLFRRLGALHVGEATDVSTRYMEVRQIVLPSGLRTFSTLQKVAVGAGDYGPYAPHRLYPGSLADTDALKAWVSSLPAG